jgi:hypothetical protein
MADDKIYTPQVIQDVPLPQDQVAIPTVSTPSTGPGGIVKPAQIAGNPIPRKIISHETISQALNTKSRRILKEFELAESGGLKIGKYTPGEHGDISLTPRGISARNSAGNTTFALDGETGDAVFSGEIQGGSININNKFEVDSEGNAIARSLALASTQNVAVAAGTSQQFTSSTQEDATGSTASIVLDVSTLVLIIVNAHGWIYQTTGGGGDDWGGNGILRLWVGGVEVERSIISGGEFSGGADRFGNLGLTSLSLHYLREITAGTKQVKLTGACDQSPNHAGFTLYNFSMSILTLGTAI